MNARLYPFSFGIQWLDKHLEQIQSSREKTNRQIEQTIKETVNGKIDKITQDLLEAKELAKESKPEVHFQLALLYGNEMKRYADAAKELKLYLKAQPEAQDKEKIESLIKTYEEKAKS